jgi:hypothetical protein
MGHFVGANIITKINFEEKKQKSLIIFLVEEQKIKKLIFFHIE